MIGRAALLLLASCAAAHAQVRVVDGDTLQVDGTRYRLQGIDAPEAAQQCGDWSAGREATTWMRALVAGKLVTCEGTERDRYGRALALCRAAGLDLGAAMVLDGMAYAYTRYSRAYVLQEQQAREQRLGVHAHACDYPWDWRKAHK